MAWTARKRKSVQGYTPGLATPWPGTVDQGWRSAVAWLFAADSWPSAAVVLDNLSYALTWALSWPLHTDHVTRWRLPNA